MVSNLQRTIAFSPPDISETEIAEVVDTLKSGWITTGPKTKLFEKKLSEYTGAPKTACLSSATAAMELVLRLLEIGPGDEVITTPYTYTASASVIDHVGAKIVMVDLAPGSFEMDYTKLAAAINEKTKAIIPVDIGGRLCDYDAIYKTVNEKQNLFKPSSELQKLFNRVVVLADSAHSFGAKYKGKISGTIADFTTFSFHAVKNLTTAEGGALQWRGDVGLDDEWLYKQIMLYSLHGQSKDALAKTKAGSWEYDIIYPAYKSNMTDITAAIGLAQLARYDGLVKRRREIAAVYDRVLKPAGIIRLEHKSGASASCCHLYLARVPGIGVQERNGIIEKLALAGISANVHYKPLPMMTAYKNKGFDIKDYPNAFAQYQNEITLPLHTLLSDGDAEYVAVNLLKAVGEI